MIGVLVVIILLIGIITYFYSLYKINQLKNKAISKINDTVKGELKDVLIKNIKKIK